MMADVTNELMYELLKTIHGDISGLKFEVGELKKNG